jgi:hypothetical protein
MQLAGDRGLVAAGIGADVQRLAGGHQEDLAQPLEPVRAPALRIAAARLFGARGEAQIEPVMAVAAEDMVGRRLVAEAHDPRHAIGDRQFGFEHAGRIGIGLQAPSPARHSTLAMCR